MGYMRTVEHLHATLHKLSKRLERRMGVGVHRIQGNYAMGLELFYFVCLYILLLFCCEYYNCHRCCMAPIFRLILWCKPGDDCVSLSLVRGPEEKRRQMTRERDCIEGKKNNLVE